MVCVWYVKKRVPPGWVGGVVDTNLAGPRTDWAARGNPCCGYCVYLQHGTGADSGPRMRVSSRQDNQLQHLLQMGVLHCMLARGAFVFGVGVENARSAG